uniref:Uncharacterized protein n=1 Tax=Leptocylindrus danicus TaxID=163516 RepID=A0A7S2PLJ6_9STRA
MIASIWNPRMVCFVDNVGFLLRTSCVQLCSIHFGLSQRSVQIDFSSIVDRIDFSFASIGHCQPYSLCLGVFGFDLLTDNKENDCVQYGQDDLRINSNRDHSLHDVVHLV